SAAATMIAAAERDAADHPPWWVAEITAHDRRAHDLAVLTLRPERPLPFLPGQHVSVQTARWPRVWRPYSIANAPRPDGTLSLHVRARPAGWVSGALVRHCAPGDTVLLGPANRRHGPRTRLRPRAPPDRRRPRARAREGAPRAGPRPPRPRAGPPAAGCPTSCPGSWTPSRAGATTTPTWPGPPRSCGGPSPRCSGTGVAHPHPPRPAGRRELTRHHPARSRRNAVVASSAG